MDWVRGATAAASSYNGAATGETKSHANEEIQAKEETAKLRVTIRARNRPSLERLPIRDRKR